ncbi:putative alginate O-acetylase AlgJ [Metapseudomonas resinovorans]|uniref:alginate O-acetyltransferase n=1 Tax=Metapseudomonas resinovorans TaxID=53412 RepID=UPI00098757D4|nr:alginate O-acetyltransferase [Pseudomonas resinovorans]GLZ86308.1 putative alginate O-acetylase AlgJ [Pseudomonas resinovorans]
MIRLSRNAYIALFLAVLLVLGAWSVRGLLDLRLPADASLHDGKMAKAVENHYEAEFPLKRLGTNLWAALDYSLFGEGRPGVVLGRQDWLFSDEEFNPLPRGEQQIEANLGLIRGIDRRLDEHGVKLLLVIVPAKARLYPEYLDEEQPAQQQLGLYRRLHAAAQHADILAPDLLASLLREKEKGLLFLRTDTHWTPHGAELVAQEVARAVQRKAPLSGARQQFTTEQAASKSYLGDLARFLPLDPLFSALLPAPDQFQPRSTHALDANPDDASAALFADVQVPVALVGTSYSANPEWNFSGALRQALGSDILDFAESGQGPLPPMLEYLQTDAFKDAPPQWVIWEFPERYLPMSPDLSQFDREWIAQLVSAGSTGPHQTVTADSVSPGRSQP